MNPSNSSTPLSKTASAQALPVQVQAALTLLGPLDATTLATLLTRAPRDIEQALLTLSQTSQAPSDADGAARIDKELLARAVQLLLKSDQIQRAAELLLQHGSPEQQLDLLEQVGWALFYSSARPLLGQLLDLNALQPRMQQGDLLGLQYIWTIEVAGEPHQVERRLPGSVGLSPALRATLQARIAQMFDQPQRAIQQAQIAIDGFPNDLLLPALLARYTLGLALLEAGDPPAATAPLSAALKGANRDGATLLQIDALQALSEVHEVLELAAPAELYAQEAQRLRRQLGLREIQTPWPEDAYCAFPQLLDRATQQLFAGNIAPAEAGLAALEQRERKAFYCFKWRNRLAHAQSWLASLRHDEPALKAIAAGFRSTAFSSSSLYELELAVLQAGCALLAAQAMGEEQLLALRAELQARPLPQLLRRLHLIEALGAPSGANLPALMQWLGSEDELLEADARWLAPKLVGPLAALLAAPAIVHQPQARSRATNLLDLLRNAGLRPATSEPLAAQAPPPGLTGREWQVLRLIGEHHSNEQIASALFVSVATVKTHINRVYSKLNIGSREEAIQRARHLGG
ncbi:helix-turn-helix transcriptional regulator [Roseateles oligotrophus]|uniref:LuxR C-terminal-related transcriptional regulator n=1 Tax=Roseateles oligotrophus TaxID=1769250 RepID=A0ABT2YLC4_9BURK|nr:LuxR C-terminal-related transcriptional regulator [Roseateles oligotrophus]MCV2370851.1 LuxR C-terminal-related transcriptional regulator [Roseateles oligotrophus]